MRLFDKKYKSLVTEHPNIQFAKGILDNLGVEKKEYSPNLAFGGGYYTDRCYEGFGLTIVSPDVQRAEGTEIYILFDGKRVQDKNIYYPGSWEKVLQELYKKIPIILERQEREEKHRNRKHHILHILVDQIASFNDEVLINDSIIIKGHDVCTGYDKEHYEGRTYTVYKDGETVFYAHLGPIYGDKYYQYTPGSWEEELALYLTKMQEEAKRREHERTETLSEDSIKQLSKLR